MTTSLSPGSRIAVIGSGVAGIVSSHLLQKRYEVTLFESDSRLGGHTSTVDIRGGSDSGLAVDTGFIVLNDRTYPLFSRFLAQIGVAIRESEMSFSYHSRTSGFCYGGTSLSGLFARRRHLISPSFYRFLWEIGRFGKEGRAFLNSPTCSAKVTLGEFVFSSGYSPLFVNNYLLPMGAAIWSAPAKEILNFPAKSFLAFFSNHGLLSLRDRPKWQTVLGGSSQYVKAFAKSFRGNILLNSPVTSVETANDLVTIKSGKDEHIFDGVVVACHADQAVKLLTTPTHLERELLSRWRYQANRVILHTDRTQLPANRRAWASWNYEAGNTSTDTAAVSVTYHMNRLQGLVSDKEYCVTLNPLREPDPTSVIAEFTYHHPQFDEAALSTQPRLRELQGQERRYFCGSYFGYGFHEDAVKSAVQVCQLLGVEL